MAKDMYQKRKERKEKAKEEKPDKGGLQKNVINWYPGHMAKTKRLIKKKIDLIDVIYEVIDARMPYSSKIRDVDDILKNKPRILIMSKKDLCDLNETDKWKNKYEHDGYKVIYMDLEHDFNMKPLINLTKEVMQEINQKRINKGMIVKKTRALVVGIPNVGKSTLINRLSGKKVATTGNKPGVTKTLSWIRINNDIELLDTPGILWPKIEEKEVSLNLASLTAIKEEILPLYDVASHILTILNQYYKDRLKERYGIDEFNEDMLENMNIIGKKRGCIIKGGEIDYDKVINIVINDIKNGNIKNITFDRYKSDK